MSIIDFYQDIATRDKLIFPLVITRILAHAQVDIPPFPRFTIMGAISATPICRSEAQLQLKWPWVETTTDPAAVAVPPSIAAPSSFAPSSSIVGVTFDAIMEQIQLM